MPRKRSSWGSNQSMGPGKRRIRYMADTGDGRGFTRHSETVYGTRKQADEVLAQRRIEHSQDKPVPTLRQAFEAWYLPELQEQLKTGELSQNTYKNYVSRWTRHINPVWGSLPITAIKPLGIQEWLLTMTQGIAETSLMLLRKILDKCVMLELLPANPANVTYRMPKQSNKRDTDVYSLSELCEVLEALRGSVAYIPAILCGIGSCRVGESLGVRKENIMSYEYDGMTLAIIDIDTQVDNNGEVLNKLKTSQSKRPIVIPEPWSKDILSIDTDWLTDKGYGKPVSQQVVRYVWNRLLKEKNLKYIPFRNLRNSWRTIMRWELGIDSDYVEKMMGHAGKGVGEIHYDRPQWRQFADVVGEAWVRYMAKNN